MSICELDINQPAVADAVVRLQQKAYAVEAEIIGFRNLPPLRETTANLRGCGEMFYGCHDNDELVGVISLDTHVGHALVCRLAVHPRHFRKGIASALLLYAEAQTASPGEFGMEVSTAALNRPAVQLYLKHGFEIAQTATNHDGVPVVSLRKGG